MTDPTFETRAEQYAASIATELLKQADEGTKLLAITYNYPKGANAFWLGFRMTAGAIFAICITVGLSKIMHWIFA